MKCALYLLISLLLFGCTPQQSRLEQELTATENELSEIPRIKIDTLGPTLGYSSTRLDRADQGDRITLTFPEPKPVDTVVLVPLNFLNSNNEYTPSGFPVRFKIEAQTVNGNTIDIADHTRSDFPCPGIAPVVFTSSDARPVQSLTISVTKLAKEQTWRSREYIFGLNELLVFSGEKNIALNADVSGENEYEIPLTYALEYLVDGYSYFPPFDSSEKNPHWDFRSHEKEVRLLFDLGEVHTLDEARFYPNNFNPQHSHIHASAIGFPMEIELQLSPDPSFEHIAPVIIAQTDRPINISSSPLCKAFKSVSGRYVQITIRNGRMDPRYETTIPILSLSEIELLNNGVNLLGDKPFQTALPLQLGDSSTVISPTILTDGNSIFGEIIPQKQWFLQLARRAELEKRKAALLLEKENTYARQQKAFRTLIVSVPFLALLFLFILLWIRQQSRKKIQLVRARIADDLHDEVGATLSGIANASELLREIHPASSAKEKELLSSIINNARRTANETRSLIRFLEQKTTDRDLFEQLQIASKQMLFGLSVTTDFNETSKFNELPPIHKWDLLLLFKEALNNIIKHADADTVEIRTFRQNKKLMLTITDNGKGLPANWEPNHLMKRAKKLKAKIIFERPKTGGTKVTLAF